MHLFLNGLAASAGGGLTYLRNVLPHLSAREGVRVTAAVSPQLRRELSGLPRVSLPEINPAAGALQRFWQEQTSLATPIRQSGADVLVSVGNFALRKSPVPQILLSRNSLYTSIDFLRDVRRRGEYGLWLDTRIKGSLARRSIAWADSTVAPTEAFAQELRQWTGRNVVAIHHGFDPEAFFRDETPLAADMRQKLELDQDALRLLYVSHYNYYRNFETLLRALPGLRERLGGRKLRLFLTCRLRSEDNPGSYRAQAAADLVAQLGIADIVVELGAVPYSLLHQRLSRVQHVRCAGLRGIICASAGGGNGERVAGRGRRFGGASRNLPGRRALLPAFFPGGIGRTSLPDCGFRRVCRSRFRTGDGRGRAPSPGTSMSMSCWIWRRIFLLQLIPFGEEVLGHRDFLG